MRSPFFIGLAAGQRTFNVEITDFAEALIDDQTAGEVIQETKPLVWTIEGEAQTVVSLRLGWQAVGDHGNGITLGLGVYVPTKAAYLAEAEYPGEDFMTQEDFELEQIDKEDQVATYGNGIWPQIELRYIYFFNLHDNSNITTAPKFGR